MSRRKASGPQPSDVCVCGLPRSAHDTGASDAECSKFVRDTELSNRALVSSIAKHIEAALAADNGAGARRVLAALGVSVRTPAPPATSTRGDELLLLRILTALERIAEALERAHPQVVP